MNNQIYLRRGFIKWMIEEQSLKKTTADTNAIVIQKAISDFHPGNIEESNIDAIIQDLMIQLENEKFVNLNLTENDIKVRIRELKRYNLFLIANISSH